MINKHFGARPAIRDDDRPHPGVDVRNPLSPTSGPGASASGRNRSRRPRLAALATALGAAALVVALPAQADASVLRLLPQNARVGLGVRLATES
ncbi:hypothetical protein [Streptomyces olivochromogenes]|uniref:hypothetical protein n=1 Tax=Streptomyces olivochromogenes TaxID=1963 RepID=UPI001F42625B|nr:hypothetical protein [Streptomyces olivochromogenes]MCF3136400.1 hypothetical protein [Streptomyces olivochromogenes]